MASVLKQNLPQNRQTAQLNWQHDFYEFNDSPFSSVKSSCPPRAYRLCQCFKSLKLVKWIFCVFTKLFQLPDQFPSPFACSKTNLQIQQVGHSEQPEEISPRSTTHKTLECLIKDHAIAECLSIFSEQSISNSWKRFSGNFKLILNFKMSLCYRTFVAWTLVQFQYKGNRSIKNSRSQTRESDFLEILNWFWISKCLFSKPTRLV